MTGLEEEVVSLARPLAFTIDASGFGTHVIHLHGIDEMGEAKTLTIDTTAAGSIAMTLYEFCMKCTKVIQCAR